MNILKNRIVLIIFSLFLLHEIQGQGLNAKLQITNIPSTKGTMYIGWYNKTEGFREQNEAVYYKKVKLNATKTTIVNFSNIIPGIYAVVIFFDENDNGILDKNFVGMPIEKYGVSNNVYPMTRAATYEEAKFNLKNQNQVISIRMR